MLSQRISSSPSGIAPSSRSPVRGGQLVRASSSACVPSTAKDTSDPFGSFVIPAEADLASVHAMEREAHIAVCEYVSSQVHGNKLVHVFFAGNLHVNDYPQLSDIVFLTRLVKLEDRSYRLRAAVMSAFMTRDRMAADVSEGGTLLSMAAEPDSGNSDSALRRKLQSSFTQVLEQGAPQEMVDLANRMANRLANDVIGLTYLPSYYSKADCNQLAKERLLHGIEA